MSWVFRQAMLGIVFNFVLLTASRFACGEDCVYWTNFANDKIQRAGLDGANIEDVVAAAVDAPMSIAVDTRAGKIYWSCAPSKIQRADLDGSNIEDLVSRSTVIVGLALDVNGGKMYWTATGNIERANLDGTGVEVLVTGQYSSDRLALDLIHQKMYWAVYSAGQIMRASLDGSDVETVLTGAGTRAVAVDAVHGKLYWGKGNDFSVRRANLDGTDSEILVDSPVADCFAITLDSIHGKLYWGGISGTLCRANLDGSGVESLTGQIGAIGGIAVASTSSLNVQLGVPDQISVEAGRPLALGVTAEGAQDPLTYQWFFRPPGGAAFEGLSAGTASRFIFPWVTPEDAGTYFCRVSSSAETVDSATITLSVEGDASLPAQTLPGLLFLLGLVLAAGVWRARVPRPSSDT